MVRIIKWILVQFRHWHVDVPSRGMAQALKSLHRACGNQGEQRSLMSLVLGFGTFATYHNQRASGGPTIITTMQIRSMICISFLTCAPLRDLPIPKA
jgi:hypothetical protein